MRKPRSEVVPSPDREQRSGAIPPTPYVVPPASRNEPWRDLGFPDLANTLRRIYTLCGWTQALEDDGRTLGITSAVEGEGKTSLAHALAIMMAQDHTGDVLLLECDLFRPSLAADRAADAGPGLSDILAGELTLEDVLRPTELPNLKLLPAGTQHNNPSRLLRSAAMTELLEQARAQFAFTVLDLPAILRSSDTAVLGRFADGLLLVVRAGHTDRRAVQQALQLLAGVNLHGVVLNRWRSTVPDVIRRIGQR
jgi:capsular exopolysaccharide synthesis family protein